MHAPLVRSLFGNYVKEMRDERVRALIERLLREGLLERSGRGKKATYRITAKGRQRVPVFNPAESWGRRWDGSWRVLTFDLPARQRTERKRLWQALRSHRVGLLQGSVWVWPHDMTAMLGEMIKAEGVPECFCGFRCPELFLCSTAEVVATAWDWDEIRRRQKGYLDQAATALELIKTSKSLAQLTAVARIERRAYDYAWLLDPLLPRELWPKGYQGASVLTRHQAVRQGLSRQLARLSPE